MSQTTDVIVLGQGLAGSTMAWHLHWQGFKVIIVDRQEPITASRAAAGLITPVTGKRMVKMNDYEAYWQYAKEFYNRVESETGEEFFYEVTMVRWFRNQEEQEQFMNFRQHQYVDNVKPLKDEAGVLKGFEMAPAGRLKTKDFLKATWAYFSDKQATRRGDVRLGSDIRVSKTGVEIPSMQLKSKRIVLTTGYEKQVSEWFPNIPDQPARGELLKVRIPNRNDDRITHQGLWIVPEGNSIYSLGSTYDRQCLSKEVSDTGKQQLLLQLPAVEQAAAEVVEHVAAVRPAMRNRKVVAELHSEEKRVGILNGLGAKGSLVSPYKARGLVERIKRDMEESESSSANILEEVLSGNTNHQGRQSLTLLVHNLLRDHIAAGDTVIDATAGNGYDTLFLAERSGTLGRVLAYDKQKTAIERTALRIATARLSNVELLMKSHDQMSAAGLPSSSVSAITFNLGYLPGSDKKVITTAEETVTAIRTGLRLLKQQGVMTVIAYRGHEGGKEEEAAVAQEIQSQKENDFRYQRIAADPQNPESPVLWVIQKCSRERSQTDLKKEK